LDKLSTDKPLPAKPIVSQPVVTQSVVVERSARRAAKAGASSALEVKDLRKSFGAAEALRGVSFSLGSGERVALLGPNGAGKTTLIRCLCGRTRPSGGKIKLFGQTVSRNQSRDLIGWVPQEIALYSDLTTRENLHAFASFHGIERRRRKRQVEWALQWTGLEKRADELVGTFSGGMKRRINLACGVLHEPKILLLDEPTVGVDPQSRQRIFTMLDQLSAGGTSILLTTHHLDEAEQRSDRIVIVDKGKVVCDGTINELVEQTVGASRLVKIKVRRQLESSIDRSEAIDQLMSRPEAIETDSNSEMLSARIDDVAIQLPQLLARVKRRGYEIVNVEVTSPSLHHVFLHLTGHDLRD